MLSLALTSCQVNWFDQHYDVPWWVITVPTVILFAIVFYAVGKYISTKKYICPKCNQSFYPKWWQGAFSLHINDDRLFKCPHCGEKNFCNISKHSDD